MTRSREHKNISSFLMRNLYMLSAATLAAVLLLSALLLSALLLSALLLAACSFDYGDTSDGDKNRPDIIMKNLEYVRVRGADPLARFRADYAERWEDRQTMEIRDFSFEQLEKNGEEINAEGRAGLASVQLESGNISLRNGVTINIESEDIVITTGGLEWKDKEKILSGAEEDEVYIERPDGTSFTGRGFYADIRNRTWTFLGEVKGTYVEEDEDEEAGEETEKIPGTVTEEKEAAKPAAGREKTSEAPKPALPGTPAEPPKAGEAPVKPTPLEEK